MRSPATSPMQSSCLSCDVLSSSCGNNACLAPCVGRHSYTFPWGPRQALGVPEFRALAPCLSEARRATSALLGPGGCVQVARASLSQNDILSPDPSGSPVRLSRFTCARALTPLSSPACRPRCCRWLHRGDECHVAEQLPHRAVSRRAPRPSFVPPQPSCSLVSLRTRVQEALLRHGT